MSEVDKLQKQVKAVADERERMDARARMLVSELAERQGKLSAALSENVVWAQRYELMSKALRAAKCKGMLSADKAERYDVLMANGFPVLLQGELQVWFELLGVARLDAVDLEEQLTAAEDEIERLRSLLKANDITY